MASDSLKRTGTQKSYTVTGKALLSIVETIKEFRSVLLGQQLGIYTNHKKLAFTF